jgi:hypothetical protein
MSGKPLPPMMVQSTVPAADKPPMTIPELRERIKHVTDIIDRLERDTVEDRIKLGADEAIGTPMFDGPLQRFSSAMYGFTITRLGAIIVLNTSISFLGMFVWTGGQALMKLLEVSIASHVDRESVYLYTSWSIILMIVLLNVFIATYTEHLDTVMPGRKIFSYWPKDKHD